MPGQTMPLELQRLPSGREFMEQKFISELAEARRDAMLDLILGEKLWDGSVVLKTPNDLYEYQMIDSLVDSNHEASQLSVFVDAVQQHWVRSSMVWSVDSRALLSRRRFSVNGSTGCRTRSGQVVSA
jgi:hypothetical protein